MKSFLSGLKSNQLTPSNDERPIDDLRRAVGVLETKLRQMHEVKNDERFQVGADVLHRCNETIAHYVDNMSAANSGNDEHLDTIRHLSMP